MEGASAHISALARLYPSNFFSPKKLEGVSALICALARLYKRASALISALVHSNFFPKKN